MDHLKRHALTGRHHSDKKSPKIDPKRPAKMDMEVESPPLVFYNQPQSSTGALFSGQLKVQVTDPTVTFEKFEMRLLATVTTKKPVSHNCPDCTTQITEIYKWEFLKAPTPLKHGDHSFPFSYLLPGHLPATTHGSLASLDYHLAAVATSSTGENITYQRSINIKRAVMPGNDKHSIRVFPPTDLTAHVTIPPVIHPIGDFGMGMRLSGLNTKTKDALTRWRLRKLSWRIEENQKFVSPACHKHAQKVGGEGKGILHDEMRIIAHEEVKSGWKTDFEEGNVDVEFKAAVNTALKPLCDVESPNGLSITHNLVIEIVVAEEWAPLKKPNQATPTGAARVLRMQFNIVLTERSGLGVSWDEEQPPMYEDVPASPPTYTQMEDFNIEELDNEVDRLRLE